MRPPDAERWVETVRPEETEHFGALFGRTAPAGAILGLAGDLGAGKTCFVRGVASGLGVDPGAVHSPSFTIATVYEGGRLPLAHVDLYRLETGRFDELFLRDVLFGNGVAAVEWVDRLGDPGAFDALIAELAYAPGGRSIRFRAFGPAHERWLGAALAGEGRNA